MRFRPVAGTVPYRLPIIQIPCRYTRVRFPKSVTYRTIPNTSLTKQHYWHKKKTPVAGIGTPGLVPTGLGPWSSGGLLNFICGARVQLQSCFNGTGRQKSCAASPANYFSESRRTRTRNGFHVQLYLCSVRADFYRKKKNWTTSNHKYLILLVSPTDLSDTASRNDQVRSKRLPRNVASESKLLVK